MRTKGNWARTALFSSEWTEVLHNYALVKDLVFHSTSCSDESQGWNELGKKAVLEWCMKEGLIGSSYVCPKCGKRMELRERTVKLAAVTSRIMGRSISAETVRNAIRHAGYSSRVAKKKPFISLQNQKKRLEFANTHQLKTDNFGRKSYLVTKSCHFWENGEKCESNGEELKIIELRTKILTNNAYKEDPEFVKCIFEGIVSNRIDEENKQKEQTLREFELQKIRLQNETQRVIGPQTKIELIKLLPTFNPELDNMHLFLTFIRTAMKVLDLGEDLWVPYISLMPYSSRKVGFWITRRWRCLRSPPPRTSSLFVPSTLPAVLPIQPFRRFHPPLPTGPSTFYPSSSVT
ncbi:uncharacterized protein TNCV_4884841, partial [Trichonephila clavipes]